MKPANSKTTSPFRKREKDKIQRMSSKSNKKVRCEVRVVGFPPTALEACCMVKVTNGPSEDEGHSHNHRQMMDTEDGEKDISYLRDSGKMHSGAM